MIPVLVFTISEQKHIKMASKLHCNEGMFKRFSNFVDFTSPKYGERVIRYQKFGRCMCGEFSQNLVSKIVKCISMLRVYFHDIS